MGVLLMLMIIGGVIVAAVMLAFTVFMKETWLSSSVFGGLAIWFAFYPEMLFGFSLINSEKDLSVNEPKKFRGFYLDCHMNVSVNDVRREKKIRNKVTAGEFYVVNAEVLSNAVKATLGLNTVDAHVIDATGQSYNRDILAEAGLIPQPEFEKRIGPGGEFCEEIVFALPSDVKNPRFDIKAAIRSTESSKGS